MEICKELFPFFSYCHARTTLAKQKLPVSPPIQANKAKVAKVWHILDMQN